MAKPGKSHISALRRLPLAEIHCRALPGHSDWSEPLNDYCGVTASLFDGVISAFIGAGCSTSDLRHLERLSDPEILQTYSQ